MSHRALFKQLNEQLKVAHSLNAMFKEEWQEEKDKKVPFIK